MLGSTSTTVTAGERLYVVTGYMNTSNTACNLSDSQSNTFTLLGTSSSLNPSFGQLNVYETIPSLAGSDSLTLNTSPCYAIGATITGSGTHDSESLGLVGGSPSSITTSLTTTAANDLVLCVGLGPTSGGGTWSAPTQSGWTFVTGVTGGATITMYSKNSLTTGSYPCTQNISGGPFAVYSAMDSFKP